MFSTTNGAYMNGTDIGAERAEKRVSDSEAVSGLLKKKTKEQS
jgi:hypothetical protein